MRGLIVAALADTERWGGHMGWDGSWWMVVWGTLMMAALAGAVVWMIRTTAASPPDRDREDPVAPARRILAERYARGELSTEEYRERSEQL